LHPQILNFIPYHAQGSFPACFIWRLPWRNLKDVLKIQPPSYHYVTGYNLCPSALPLSRPTYYTQLQKDFSQRRIRLVLSSYHLLKVKANEVGRACSTHVRGEKVVQGFGGKVRRKETARKTKE
jgi:hypothetical protein